MYYAGSAMLLLTAIGGYWVMERANTHRGQFKKFGMTLGILIILTSLLGVLCNVWSQGSGKHGYHHGKKESAYHLRHHSEIPLPKQ